MSPEFSSQKIFTHKSDVYSYGILLWEIFTESEPYADLHPVQILFQVNNNVSIHLYHSFFFAGTETVNTN